MSYHAYTMLSAHIVHDRISACVDLEVKRLKVKVTRLSRALPALVYLRRYDCLCFSSCSSSAYNSTTVSPKPNVTTEH